MKLHLFPILAATIVFAAPLSAAMPALASPAADEDISIQFNAGAVPVGQDQLVSGTFSRTGHDLAFQLNRPVLPGGVAGACREAVGADGGAMVTCQFGRSGADPATRLALNWTASGGQVQGQLQGRNMPVMVERTITPADGEVWSFKANGRIVATADRFGLHVENGLAGRLERDIIAAAFIIQQLA